MAYQGQYSTSWQLVLAFITLTILPAIVIFLLAQRWIVAGLTAGRREELSGKKRSPAKATPNKVALPRLAFCCALVVRRR